MSGGDERPYREAEADGEFLRGKSGRNSSKSEADKIKQCQKSESESGGDGLTIQSRDDDGKENRKKYRTERRHASRAPPTGGEHEQHHEPDPRGEHPEGLELRPAHAHFAQPSGEGIDVHRALGAPKAVLIRGVGVECVEQRPLAGLVGLRGPFHDELLPRLPVGKRPRGIGVELEQTQRGEHRHEQQRERHDPKPSGLHRAGGYVGRRANGTVGLVGTVGDWMRGCWAIALLLGGAGQVDAGNGFGGVMSGAATATATAGMTGAETEGDDDDDDDDDDTAGGTEIADSTGGDDPTGGAQTDGSTGTDTPNGSTSSMGMTDGTTGGAGACMGAALDAALEVPPLCEPTCNAIGFGSDCPGIEICRLKDSQTAVCESCEPCGNLHAPCTASSQCDILFTCYLGQCTAMCDFNTPQTCGNPMACTDVGHPTHGVCDPNI